MQFSIGPLDVAAGRGCIVGRSDWPLVGGDARNPGARVGVRWLVVGITAWRVGNAEHRIERSGAHFAPFLPASRGGRQAGAEVLPAVHT